MGLFLLGYLFTLRKGEKFHIVGAFWYVLGFFIEAQIRTMLGGAYLLFYISQLCSSEIVGME